MKSDLYTKAVLTIIAILLLVLAVHPTTQTVQADATGYKYSFFTSDNLRGGSNLVSAEDKASEIMDKMAAKGAELVAVVPFAGTRNDNIGTGTIVFLYVIRYPKNAVLN
jgi:hypothetical protein